MAINFETLSSPQYVSFGEIESFKGLTQKTICAWITPESLSEFQHIFNINTQLTFTLGDYDGVGGYQLMLSNGKIRFISFWTGVSGSHDAAWDSSGAIGAGNLGLVCASYDNSSTGNDPSFYVNGVASGVTEIVTPSGSLMDYATEYIPTTKIGTSNTNIGSSPQFDGIVHKVLVYNRILTAAEILDMYNSRGASYPRNGLVSCPMLYGAKGLQVADGVTLAAGNTIIDPCSGAVGVPTGSPVMVGEQYLSIR